MFSMNLNKVKERIQYDGEFAPTLKVLTNLQKKFLLHVPFENLDIHMDIPMDLSEPSLFQKIIDRNRGDLCFENNSLFYGLLKQIGFTVHFVGAEMYQNKPFSSIINHMALLVSIKNELYLIDVGNGRFYGRPIPIGKQSLIKGEDTKYLIGDYMGHKTLLFLDQNGQKQPRYAFDVEPKQRDDFIQPSIYTQTSPDSIFRQKILVTKLLSNGRLTLSDTKLIFTRKGKQNIKALQSAEEYPEILVNKFGILLEEQQLASLIRQIDKKLKNKVS